MVLLQIWDELMFDKEKIHDLLNDDRNPFFYYPIDSIILFLKTIPHDIYRLTVVTNI